MPQTRTSRTGTPAVDLITVDPMTDLRDRILAATEGQADLAQLTPEQILGLSSVEVTRLRRLQPSGQYPALPLDPQNIWRGQRRSLNIGSGRAALVRAETGGQNQVRQRVANALGHSAAAHGVLLVVEELAPTETTPLSREGLSGTWLHVLMPAASAMTATIRLNGRTISAVPERPTAGELIRVDDQVVARHEADSNLFTLFCNPWLRGTALTSADTQQRAATTDRILTAIVDYADNIWREGTHEPATADLLMRDAILTLDLLPGFARAIRGDIDVRRQQITQQLYQIEREVATARQQFVEALRQQTQLSRDVAALDSVINGLDKSVAQSLQRRREPIANAHEQQSAQVARSREQLVEILRRHTTAETERVALEANAQTITPEHLATALTEVTRIRAIRTVRAVELVSRRGDIPSIKITLHPLVLQHQRHNYLFDRLVFTLALDGSQRVVWESIRQAHRSPHPHVSTGGTSCWGQAQTPLQQALERREFSTAVRFINGWARVYNNNSPYVHIEQFPHTDLAEGWHPELPMATL